MRFKLALLGALVMTQVQATQLFHTNRCNTCVGADLTSRVWDLLDPSDASHPLEVFVRDPWLLTATFDDQDLFAVGPDGVERSAVFVLAQYASYGVDDHEGFELIYELPAPDGGWTDAHDGEHSLFYRAGGYERVDGSFFEYPQKVGTFHVRIGDEFPQLPEFEVSMGPLGDGVEILSPESNPSLAPAKVRVLVRGLDMKGTYVRELNPIGQSVELEETDVGWRLDFSLATIPQGKPCYPNWLPRLQGIFGGGVNFNARSLGRTYLVPLGEPRTFELYANGRLIGSASHTAEVRPRWAVVQAPTVYEPAESSLVTIKYWMPNGIDPDSLGNEDFNVRAWTISETVPKIAFVGAAFDELGWLCATYRLESPQGLWSAEDNGVIGLELGSREVRSLEGEFFPRISPVGVEVEIGRDPSPDLSTGISATLTSPQIERLGAASFLTQVVFEHPDAAIDPAWLEHALSVNYEEVQGTVSADTVLREFVSLNDGRRVEAVYEVSGPLQGFVQRHAPLNVKSALVRETNGRYIPIGEIKIPANHELPGVFPTLSTVSLGVPGFEPFRFSVIYRSGSAIDPGQLGKGEITVFPLTETKGQLGTMQVAALVSANVRKDGNRIDGIYEILPPDAGWSHLNAGSMQVWFDGAVRNEAGELAEREEFLRAFNVGMIDPQASVSARFFKRTDGQPVGLFNALASRPEIQWRAPIVLATGKIIIDGTVPVHEGRLRPSAQIYESQKRMVLGPLAEVGREVLVRLNGEVIAIERIPALELLAPEPLLPAEVNLSTLKVSNTRYEAIAKLSFEVPGIVIDDWGVPEVDGEVISINASVQQDPNSPEVVPMGGVAMKHYDLGEMLQAQYQLLISVNGEPTAETFFGTPALLTPYVRLRQKQLTLIDGQDRRQNFTLLGDLDADGVSDYEEFAFGTDPLDPGEREPTFEIEIVHGPLFRKIPIVTVPVRSDWGPYEMQTSTDLQTWRTLNQEKEATVNYLGGSPYRKMQWSLAPLRLDVKERYYRLSLKERS